MLLEEINIERDSTGRLIFDPGKAFLEKEKASEVWAEAAYQYTLLDEDKKNILSVLCLKYKAEKRSLTEIEWMARADPEYRGYTMGVAVAKKNFERARARYNNLVALGEDRRTQEVTARMLGGNK